MAFCWRADDGLLIVVFGSCLPSSAKKKVVKVGTLRKKLSGSVHKILILYIATDSGSSVGSMSPGANALRVTLGPCTVIDDEKTPVPQSPISDPFSDGSSKEANGGTVKPV